jgi:hypothetical protein
LEQIKGWNWRETDIVHPDDVECLFEEWSAIIASAQEGKFRPACGAQMASTAGSYFVLRQYTTRPGNCWDGSELDLEIDERKRRDSRVFSRGTQFCTRSPLAVEQNRLVARCHRRKAILSNRFP